MKPLTSSHYPKAAEKLGIFPSLPLGGIAAWIRQNGFPVELIDLMLKIFFRQMLLTVCKNMIQKCRLTAKTLG